MRDVEVTFIGGCVPLLTDKVTVLDRFQLHVVWVRVQYIVSNHLCASKDTPFMCFNKAHHLCAPIDTPFVCFNKAHHLCASIRHTIFALQ